MQFILRLVFATPEQLGWDETIRRIEPQNGLPIHYDIELNGKWYRTICLLSNVGAEALRGRGTRVWEVKELSEHNETVGPSLVLKDCWIDSTREPEGEILQAIRASAERRGPRYSSAINKYFMDTVDYGKVLVGGRPDHTLEVMRRGKAFPGKLERLAVKADPTEMKTVVSNLPVAGATPAPRKQEEAPLQYSAKVHHRTLFKQVGKRLTSLTSLSKVFKHLASVVAGSCAHFSLALPSFADSSTRLDGAAWQRTCPPRPEYRQHPRCHGGSEDDREDYGRRICQTSRRGRDSTWCTDGMLYGSSIPLVSVTQRHCLHIREPCSSWPPK